jgi:hypothetical protein
MRWRVVLCLFRRVGVHEGPSDVSDAPMARARDLDETALNKWTLDFVADVHRVQPDLVHDGLGGQRAGWAIYEQPQETSLVDTEPMSIASTLS